MADDRVMVITGASRGIGRHLAGYYASCGYQVVGCSRTSSDLESENYQHFCLDVAEEPSVKHMFGEIRKLHGGLDVLINNAGVGSTNPAMLTPVESLQNVFNTNVVGTFLFCREAAKLMRKRGNCRIVNFASMATPLQLEGESVYASSKAAVVSLTQVLARELAEFGITVNAVGPPTIMTDFMASATEKQVDKLLDRHAVKRLGEYADVSNVIDFFIRPESHMVTGEVIYLGGL